MIIKEPEVMRRLEQKHSPGVARGWDISGLVMRSSEEPL